MASAGKKVKGLILNLGVLFVTIIVFLVIAEIIARLFVIPPIATFDPTIGSVMQPDAQIYNCNSEFCVTLRTNNQGFLDTDFIPGEQSIQMFGDSFLAAEQIDMTLAAHSLLERGIGGDYNLSVQNFGQSGYGIGQYYIGMNKQIDVYDPQLIVFVIFLGNDFKNINPNMDGACKPYFALQEDGLYQLPLTCRQNKVTEFAKSALRSSVFFTFIYEKAVLTKERLRQSAPVQQVPIDYSQYEINRSTFSYSFALGESIMYAADQLAKENGVPMLFVGLPAREQIDQEQWNKIVTTWSLDASALERREPIFVFNEICTRLQLDCLDLSKSFSTYNTDELYLVQDGHLNEKGNEVFAQTLEAYIRSSQVIAHQR